MNRHALNHAVDRAGGARRIGRVAHAHGVEQADGLGKHHERQGEVALGKCLIALKGERLALVDGSAILLNGNGVLSDLVATDLVEDVDIVLTGVGVVVDEHEDERLIVDEGLRSVTIAHGGVVGSSNQTVSELEDLELALLGKAAKGAGAQVGHAVEVASEVVGNLGLASDDLLAHLGDGLDPLGLLLVGSLVKDEGREQGHAGVGAGHGKALVVGARDEQRQRIGIIGGLDSELALGSAGDVEELDVVDELLGNGDSSKALGAVARAGKGNHERGILGAQEVARGAHDISRGDGLKVVEISVASVTQVRGAGIANIVGRTGTGEDNGQTALAHSASLGQKGLDGLLVLAIDVERITPKLGLLSNLGRGDLGAELGELLDTLLEHF